MAETFEAASRSGGETSTTGRMAAADVAELVQTERVAEAQGQQFLTHMLAGAAAGMAEHTVMYPVDTIKTRMQALSHPGQQLHRSTVTRALQVVLKREGWRGLYRGVGAVVTGTGPAHAVYFSAYEAAKEALGGNREGHQPLATSAAGAFATLTSEAVNLPMDVVKQRLQVLHSPYKGIMDAVVRTVREEGLGAFYKSYRTTVLMNVPFTAIHFTVYESTKKLLRQEEEETLLSQLTAGGLAGGCAAAVTNPLDLVKTRLQLEGVGSATRYKTNAMIPTLRSIIEEEGTSALWRGVQPRVLFHVPAAAICYGTYETIKKLLQEQT